MSSVPRMAYDENSPTKNTAGKAVLPIPGGKKLLSNVEETGRLLIETLEAVKEFGDALSREDLIEMIEGHAKIGQVMIAAVERVREKMEI